MTTVQGLFAVNRIAAQANPWGGEREWSKQNNWDGLFGSATASSFTCLYMHANLLSFRRINILLCAYLDLPVTCHASSPVLHTHIKTNTYVRILRIVHIAAIPCIATTSIITKRNRPPPLLLLFLLSMLILDELTSMAPSRPHAHIGEWGKRKLMKQLMQKLPWFTLLCYYLPSLIWIPSLIVVLCLCL